MSEAKIIQAIANACQDPTLYFQIIVQDYTLRVYITRQNNYLDYQAITVKNLRRSNIFKLAENKRNILVQSNYWRN